MNKTTAKSTLRNFSSLQALFIILSIVIYSAMNTANAASKGKLGTQSSASVQISVTVKQTFNAISPTELLVQDKQSSKKSLCVAHHGFSNHASVPYKLIVDDIKVFNDTKNTNEFQHKVFLEDKNHSNSKQRLTQGMTIEKQSKLNINKNLNNDCASAGLDLSIEENSNIIGESGNTGLLVLMISPS